ncbi:MAG: hypothetical protein NTV06_08935 [candidate division Zixibacteria bacterium]|nr:hypothetical protein [candidate division Zixibacteria bacterium]
MRKIASDNKGSLLIIVLCLMAMLTMVGILSIENSTTDVNLAYNQLHNEAALYVADAGAAMAIAKIRANKSYNTGYRPELSGTIGNGTYSIEIFNKDNSDSLWRTGDSTILSDDTLLLIVSTGVVQNAKAQVKALAVNHHYTYQQVIWSDSGLLVPLPADKKPICTLGTMSYTSHPDSFQLWYLKLQDGNIRSNGRIDLSGCCSGSPYIRGDVETSIKGGLICPPGYLFDGDTTSTMQKRALDTLPDIYFTQAQMKNDNLTGVIGSDGKPYAGYNPTNKSLVVKAGDRVKISGGHYYFSSITIGDGGAIQTSNDPAAGNAANIYVGGDITMSGKRAEFNNRGAYTSNCRIFSKGNRFTITEGDHAAFNGIFRGNHTEFTTRSYEGLIWGALEVKRTRIENKTGLYFDRYLMQQPGVGDDPEWTSTYAIAWRQGGAFGHD